MAARSLFQPGGAIAALLVVAACSSSGGSDGTSSLSGSGGAQGSSSSAGSGTSGGTGGAASSSANAGTGGDVSLTIASAGPGGSSGTGGGCMITNMDADMDGDGWTPNQGDCNDCDANVNPGAIDVPGDPKMVDNDCSGTYDPPAPCDSGLALDDLDAKNGARAIELCQFTTATPATPKDKTWGVLEAAYVHADGSAFPNPGAQVGIQPSFGANVHPQGGGRMLLISSGHARTPSQADACGSKDCATTVVSNPPSGFPQDNPNCPPSKYITDDIALEVKLRAPTNATGLSFNFKFYSFEFPEWVCNKYNDQFIALVSPSPAGSINGNISFDSLNNPVSVNLGFFDVCDPLDQVDYASNCQGASCPHAPSPYCPKGTSELLGTGFDVWDIGYMGSISAGATTWLVSQAPVKGGEEVTIRFAMWDTGDQNYDSSTLVDNFAWVATPGVNVPVGTTPVETPK